MNNRTRSRFNLAIMLLSLGIVFCGCSSQYQVSTNLDKENFKRYFAATKVAIIEHEQQLPFKHKLIGLVEGEDCQLKPHLAKPDVINARTKARQAAFDKGANAVIFTGCTEIESKTCIASTVCYAKAYQVEK